MKGLYQNIILQELKDAKLDYIIVVPSSGVNNIYDYFELERKCIYVTREEEGLALAAGLSIGGKRVILFIQQSGVGNLLNALFTLAEPYKIFFSIVVLIRGTDDENIIHHYSSMQTQNIILSLQGVEINLYAQDNKESLSYYINQKKRWIYFKY